MSVKKSIFFWFVLILSSCNDSKSYEQLSGTYSYTYPSGLLEILVIKDSSYTQKIYRNKVEYLNNVKPMYNNSGNLKIKDGNLNFYSWLSICYLTRDIDSIMERPNYLNLTKIPWQTHALSKDVEITIYDDNGYVFTNHSTY